MKINIEKLGFPICSEAKDYYNTKASFQQAWKECHRGDWMLSFARQIGVDIRTLTLAKALCAKTVIHLMKDQRSVNAVLVAEKYGRGEATEEELKEAYKHAYEAYYFSKSDLSTFIADAAYASAIYACHDGYAASASAVASNTAVASYDAYPKNQQATADTCRDILTKKVFEKLKII